MVAPYGAVDVTVYSGRFEGRTAIVTGAASGIGRDVARRLAAEGARVSMWDLNASALATAAVEVGAAHTQAVDIAVEDSVDAAMRRSIDVLGGRLDVLVASAGITGPNAAVKDYSASDWRKVFDVNVNGAFYSNRAAVRIMEKSGYGRIVNVASVAGKEGNPNASAYSASRAAVGAHQIAGQGNGHDRHPRQLHHARGDQNTAVRPDDSSAHRFYAVEDTARAVRYRRGSDLTSMLARERRMLV
jgi:2-dehydro-3-deoxy-L-rhamnonate dehydrogenase (NAD+)